MWFFALKQIKEETTKLPSGTDTLLSHKKMWAIPQLLKSTVRISVQGKKTKVAEFKGADGSGFSFSR